MAEPTRPGEGEIDPTPGIAGGPGPTPPGLDDGTPAPREATPETPVAPEAQRREGEAAERSAGTRRADVPGLSGEREGAHGHEDPDVAEAERRTRR